MIVHGGRSWQHPNPLNIGRLRLHHQQIATHPFSRPEQVVEWMGAVQAQDYAGALWGIGLRLPRATQRDVEKAIAERKIVRTWPMRGTLHFVAAADVHWMRSLLTPRIIARSALRQRQLELDAAVFARCEKIFLKELRGGKQLTREEMFGLLEKARIQTGEQRGYHILWRLAQEGLLCFGAHAGKQATFTLLDEWIPSGSPLDREAALARLALRYFRSHGPARLEDFVAWTALTMTDAKLAIRLVEAELQKTAVGGKVYWHSADASVPRKSSAVYLLPGFDEFILGYRDRSQSLDPGHSGKVNPSSNGMFISTIVVDGQVLGTWRRVFKGKKAVVTAMPFAKLSGATPQAFSKSAKAYGQFVDCDVVVSE